VANPAEDRLLNKLLHSRRYNPLTIPASDVGQTVQVKLGLGIQKIVQVVTTETVWETIKQINCKFFDWSESNCL